MILKYLPTEYILIRKRKIAYVRNLVNVALTKRSKLKRHRKCTEQTWPASESRTGHAEEAQSFCDIPVTAHSLRRITGTPHRITGLYSSKSQGQAGRERQKRLSLPWIKGEPRHTKLKALSGPRRETRMGKAAVRDDTEEVSTWAVY